MSGTAVIEYQWKGYIPPGDGEAWSIEAAVTHAAGLVIRTGSQILADLRTELEEAGLRKAGASIVTKYGNPARPSQLFPRWREVWQHKDKVSAGYNNQLSPRAQKARQESAARTRLYQSRMEEKEEMKDDPRLLELARKAKSRHPELTSRAMNAAELVRAGKVKRISVTTFRVQSQTSKGEYTVDIHQRTCTCDDHAGTFRHKAPEINGAPMCKHRLACLMKVKLGQRETDPAAIHREEKRIAALQAGAILI